MRTQFPNSASAPHAILIVDDNFLNHKLMRVVLMNEGCEVLTARAPKRPWMSSGPRLLGLS
jgi:hypothetical protein